MKDLTNLINDHLRAVKALVFYEGKKDDCYVECYDMNGEGMAINSHPLSVRESQKLADALDSSIEVKASYLNGIDLFPQELLYINSESNGFIVWYTPARSVNLFFKAELGLADGSANIPALVWKATRQGLWIWAVKEQGRPDGQSQLFCAPFLNVYDSGSVCMGSVRVDVPKNCSVSQFKQLWEHYFFDSSFSHTIAGSDKLIGVWGSLIGTDEPFPTSQLKKANKKLIDILR
ncbi:MAG: PRTRC system protein B [Pedobacter sp.]|nr:MAG: PRTRC system protein B [Pedobacter sp.]